MRADIILRASLVRRKKEKKKKGKREEKKTERVCSFSLSRAFHCASVNVFAWRGLFKDARRLIVGDFPKGRRIMYYPGVGTSMFVRQVHGKFGFWLNPSGFPRTLAEVRFMISQCVCGVPKRAFSSGILFCLGCAFMSVDLPMF